MPVPSGLAGRTARTRQDGEHTHNEPHRLRELLRGAGERVGASVGEVAGDIKSIEYAIEATAAGAVAKEMGASLIGDTDYAVDTAKLAAQQVISQAATAILAQANARSATVLTLLK